MGAVEKDVLLILHIMSNTQVTSYRDKWARYCVSRSQFQFVECGHEV